MIITNLTIDSAKQRATATGKEQWVTEAWPRGEGRFRLRAFPNGKCAYYFRYSLDGVQKQIPIKATELAEARAEARKLSVEYIGGQHDLHAFKEGQALVENLKIQAEAARLQAEKTAREVAEAERARQGTLAQLLDAYVADLERRGKPSYKDVRGAFRLDVLNASPQLAAKPAKEVVPDDIAGILRRCLTRPVASKGRGRRLTKASASNGKLRQASKLRSYLQAAFSFGLGFDLNPLRAAATVLFGLTTNPARDVPTIEGADRAETWSLTKDELLAVLLAIEDLTERRRSIAKAMLYLAGQRVQMLTRVIWADLYDDEHGAVMQMMDLKGGKGTPPRLHLLPMTQRLSEVMAPLLALRGTGAPGPFTLRGRMPATSGTLQKIFSELGEVLAAEGKTRRFTWLNVRVTVETHLASLGVNAERRAWLLSHGRSGVQAKHYDRYSYLPEKRQDLDKWARYLDQLVTGEAAKVVPLHARGEQ